MLVEVEWEAQLQEAGKMPEIDLKRYRHLPRKVAKDMLPHVPEDTPIDHLVIYAQRALEKAAQAWDEDCDLPFRAFAIHQMERDILIEQYEQLPGYVVKKWAEKHNRLRNLNYDDLVAHSKLQMVISADRFDRHRGTKFVTYAMACMKMQLLSIALKGCLIRLPAALSSPTYWARWKKGSDYLEAAKKASFVLSLENMLAEDLVPEGICDDLTSKSAADEAEANDDHATSKRWVAELMKWLSPRDQKVIHLRIWKGLTLSAIGEKLGRSKERIRQIEKRAFKKMRAVAESIKKKQPAQACQEDVQ
jgi:RNA polymerase primary sigma factor